MKFKGSSHTGQEVVQFFFNKSFGTSEKGLRFDIGCGIKKNELKVREDSFSQTQPENLRRIVQILGPYEFLFK